MKIRIQSRRCEQGMATVVMLSLLSIILIYLSINVRSISNLEREVKLVEQKQIKRLNVSAGATNAVVKAVPSQSITP